jgi:hypothetical protein
LVDRKFTADDLNAPDLTRKCPTSVTRFSLVVFRFSAPGARRTKEACSSRLHVVNTCNDEGSVGDGNHVVEFSELFRRGLSDFSKSASGGNFFLGSWFLGHRSSCTNEDDGEQINMCEYSHKDSKRSP